MSTDAELEPDFTTEPDFTAFDPRGYLHEYYTSIDFENDQLLRFLSSCYRESEQQSTLLEFGSGPTLYSLITAATKVETLCVCDRLEANLQEIKLWQREDDRAFNWDPFIRRTLEIEGNFPILPEDIQQRAALLRSKLRFSGFCDAFHNPPLAGACQDGYDIVQVNFVPESITTSLARWECALHNILTLLKPQGTLILTALKNARYYHLQQKKFPAVNIDEMLLAHTLARFGFLHSNMTVQTIPANHPYRGYSGIILIKAQRKI